MTTADGMKVCLTKNHTWWLTLATALIAWLVSSYAIEPASVTFRPFRMDSRRICDTSLLTPPLPKRTPSAHTSKQRSHEISNSFGELPLSFEVNQGQLDPLVKFVSRGRGYTLSLTANEAVFHFWSRDRKSRIEQPHTPSDARPTRLFSFFQIAAPELSPVAGRDINQPLVNRRPSDRRPEVPNLQSRSVRMKLIGSNPGVAVEGIDRLPGITNYFIGNNPEKWRTNIQNYSRVRYRDIYPGVDLVYYGNPDQLEYDVVVAPGVDPQSFLMTFDGADHLSINENGDLVMEIAGSRILQHKPQVYQWIRGKQRTVPGEYRLTREMQVAFSVGDHDVTKPLFIDPILSFSFTFTGRGSASGIVLDSSGSACIIGEATPNFQTTPGAFQTTTGDAFGADAFVAKLNPAGTELVYSTFLGGSGSDTPTGIVVDQSGNAYIAGFTNSSNFPTTPGALQPAYASGSTSLGPSDAFVTKLNPTGTALLYSTYLGGKDNDSAAGIAVDAVGNAYTTGSTSSTDFPVSPAFPNPPGAFQKSYGGSEDVFVAKLNPLGSALVYSTYLGGVLADFSAGLKVNSAGEAYVAGTTGSANFPVTAGAYQTQFRGGPLEVFATRLNASGTGLIYSTYLGGAEEEIAAGLALDSQENLYISGADRFSGGSGLSFVKILNSAGTHQVYSTHLAGGFPPGTSLPGTGRIEVDSAGNVYVLDSQSLKKLNPREDSILSTIPFGGFDPRLDITSFALNPAGEIYVTGWKGTGARIYCGGESISYEDQNVYVAKWTETESATLFVPIVLSAAGLNSSFFTSELTLTNRGPKDARLDLTYVAAFGDGSGSVTTTLPAGKQQIFPDAIEYLRTLGLPIPATGDRGGTLSIHFSGVSSSSDVAALVRTTTAAGGGRAGLAYAAVPAAKALNDPVYLLGLRQNEQDRSNVAVQNAGGPGEGDTVLRLTIFSGDRGRPLSLVLPEIQLGPGEFRQINGILNSAGGALQSGYVLVEKLSGLAPYYAYGVINDQMSSDGSFVPPTPRFLAAGQATLWLPAVVESDQFNTEVVVTNWSASRKVVQLSFQAQALANDEKTAFVSIELEGGEQKIIPSFVQYLRDHGSSDVGPTGPTYVGTVIAIDVTQPKCRNLQGVSVSARTSAQGVGGNYGVFYSGVPQADTSVFSSVWLYSLQQNTENRTNLALATGVPGSQDEFRIELFDGDLGSRVSLIENVTLGLEPWKQLNSILANYAPTTQQGYARVSRTKGGSPFIAYAVINDGSAPGERTGDGAFISSSP